MNRPNNMQTYSEVDLKLGIKSSLPNVKSVLGLVLLFWECANRPATLNYSMEEGNLIVVNPDLEGAVKTKLMKVVGIQDTDFSIIIENINNNNLFKSQLESLIVAFELVWKIAKVSFVDTNKPASAERTGMSRFDKKLEYTINADIISTLFDSEREEYMKVLLNWIGFEININSKYEDNLIYLLMCLSETSIFKLVDSEQNIIFNQSSIYSKVLESEDGIDINGDKEPKGSLRILKSLLLDGLNPFLNYSNGTVTGKVELQKKLEEYSKRVEMYLRLSSTKLLFKETPLEIDTADLTIDFETERKKEGENVLFYGVPGSGKSHTIETQYGSERMTRVVFHPDYMSTDFVGQILPTVKQEEGSDEKLITYEFTPGPFTNVMEKAYKDPENMYYLVIEEINRGNAPAIFGEIFQLLDRDEKGTSKYAVVNYPVARAMYGDEQQPIRIPSNLTILATMNTSDQNVFTLDTAFQRRWTMRMIINDIDKADHKDVKICDTDVTWKIFNEVINDRILNSNATLLSSEDKRLGAYFVTKADLEKEKDVENRFSEKVIKYLWDDAFKFSRDKIFDPSFRSLEQVIQYFVSNKGEKRFGIFNSEVKTLIEDRVKAQKTTPINETDSDNSSAEEEQLDE